MTADKSQQFLDTDERWKTGTASENDRLLIQDVLQTGWVIFGQNNQVSACPQFTPLFPLGLSDLGQARKFPRSILQRIGA